MKTLITFYKNTFKPLNLISKIVFNTLFILFVFTTISLIVHLYKNGVNL